MSGLAIKGDQPLAGAYNIPDHQSPAKKGEISQYRCLGSCEDILTGQVEATEEVYLMALYASKVEPLIKAIERVESRLSGFDRQVSELSVQHPDTPVDTIHKRLFDYLLDDATKFAKKIQKLISTYPKAEPLFYGQDMRLKEIIQQMSQSTPLTLAEATSPSSPSNVSAAPSIDSTTISSASVESFSNSAPMSRTTLVIDCAIGPTNELFLRAHLPEKGLSWDKGIQLTRTPEGNFSFNVDIETDFEFKVLINDWNWSAGPNMIAKGNQAIAFTPTFEHPI